LNYYINIATQALTLHQHSLHSASKGITLNQLCTDIAIQKLQHFCTTLQALHSNTY
jgi:hypothetical protein